MILHAYTLQKDQKMRPISLAPNELHKPNYHLIMYLFNGMTQSLVSTILAQLVFQL